MTSYDAIVVGLGGIGSAALFHLAKRGVRVLGIEPNGMAHDRGSSHGHTRLIRKAYFEHASYVPLVEQSIQLWSQLEAASGVTLHERTGLLLIGTPGSSILSNVRTAAREHSLAIDAIAPSTIRRDFPAFQIEDDFEALWEQDAGLLYVEACVRTHIEQACTLGAEVRLGEGVKEWHSSDRCTTITTSNEVYVAERVVFCVGPWTGRILSSFRLPIEIRRKVMMWFAAPEDHFGLSSGFPVYCFDLDGDFFYGFPCSSDSLCKIAQHSGGQVIEDPSGIDRTLHLEDTRPVVDFVKKHLPQVDPAVRRHAVCMYSMTPDQRFVIDFLTDAPPVIVAAGFSGHGFKFAPVVGSMLAQLVLGHNPSDVMPTAPDGSPLFRTIHEK